MSRLSQSRKIVEFLKSNPKQKYTARQIAEQLVTAYPEDYEDKRVNPRFEDEKAFITQIVAEIGSQKQAISRLDPHVFWQDKPRPRMYWYDADRLEDDEGSEPADQSESLTEPGYLTEQELYPVLMEYLLSELNVHCRRIDEKRSRNSRGIGGNQWLHPDVVGLEAVDAKWDTLVRECATHGHGQRVRLWSFEVKKELHGSNVRKAFFQAVSNSSWANEGYLVACELSDRRIESELMMLSALHGIGVILLNVENPSESEIVLPARAKDEADWQSVNRLAVENSDFREYIELVSAYYQTGRLKPRDWAVFEE